MPLLYPTYYSPAIAQINRLICCTPNVFNHTIDSRRLCFDDTIVLAVVVPCKGKHSSPDEIDGGEVRIPLTNALDYNRSRWPNTPVLRVEDRLQLEHRVQSCICFAFPGTPVCRVCVDRFFGFYSQPHITLPVAVCNDSGYRRSEEVNDIKKRVPGIGDQRRHPQRRNDS